MAATLIGTPVNRVDGRKKVTGVAQYAAEVALGEMTYAVLVGSAVGGGRIRGIDIEEAERAPGVLLVLTHQNAEHLGQTAGFAYGRRICCREPCRRSQMIAFYMPGNMSPW